MNQFAQFIAQFRPQAQNASVAPVATPNATSVITKKPVVGSISSNVSSTAPNPAPIVAPTTPAKQAYTQSLAQPTQDLQKYGSTVTDTMGRQGIAKFDPNTGAPLQDPNGADTSTPDPQAKYRDAFESYAKSLAMPDELVNTNKALADVNSTIFGKQLSSRRQYEETLDAPGGLKSGAQQSAQLVDRRNNSELADLAVQQNALANTAGVQQKQYENLTAAGKARFDFEKGLQDDETKANAPFDLSEGQSRYQYNPQTGKFDTIASKGKTYAPSTGTGGSAGGNATAAAIMANPALWNSLTPSAKTALIPTLSAMGFSPPANLSAGQQDDIATMDTVSQLADKVLALGDDLPGVGAFGSGTLSGIGANLGLGTTEGIAAGQKTRDLVGNIKATIAKLRGGTSFTPNEQTLLDTYTPTINDSDAVIRQKLTDLKDYIAQKKQNTLSSTTAGSSGGASSGPIKATTSSGLGYTIIQ